MLTQLFVGHIMQVFDNESFETLLAQSTSQGFHAVYSLQVCFLLVIKIIVVSISHGNKIDC